MGAMRKLRDMGQDLPGKESGSVLVVTLLVVLLLAALTLAFSDETGVELALSETSRNTEQAYLTARSGVQEALALMSAESDKDMDTLRDEWLQNEKVTLPDDFMEGSSLTVRVADESGKFNLNTLVDGNGDVDDLRASQARRLFRALGVAEELLEPLLDWLDRDDIERINGAESKYYSGLDTPFSCANGTLQTLGQLAMIKGYDKGLMTEDGRRVDLTPYVTLYTNGKINVNTAPPEVLQCLGEQLDSAMANAIAVYRRSHDLRTMSDLAKVTGLSADLLSGVSPWVTFKSTTVSVESRGSYRETSRTVRAVVERSGEKATPRLIYWKVD
ncbi:MAG: general secretion pathway protein GspK [Desulfobacteraceae bacterium]|nr:MAG: general secretion pathway protein GspK [Desulfobacteraceae bacterium]